MDVSPTPVVILTNSLLLVLILLNLQHYMILWKSSSLVLLFHGLEGWHQDELGGDRSQIESTVEECAGSCNET